ncbi:MAG: hypothetical protein HC933_09480 [Pleurocapsa sp. SU_196_0]|nr:hypothetical protein [Pleurocapsa sp. SU_196_0]
MKYGSVCSERGGIVGANCAPRSPLEEVVLEEVEEERVDWSGETLGG